MGLEVTAELGRVRGEGHCVMGAATINASTAIIDAQMGFKQPSSLVRIHRWQSLTNALRQNSHPVEKAAWR